jgi:hypothetical protein
MGCPWMIAHAKRISAWEGGGQSPSPAPTDVTFAQWGLLLHITNTKFESLEEEVQVKGKQLKKLFEKYQAKWSEIGDLQAVFLI